MKRRNLTLIGFQACGKTTLGALLAERLQKPFIDTDRLIEAIHPSFTCSQIFKTFGEAYFRQLESQVIQQLQQHQDVIIAIGGGSLLQEQNRLSLKQHSWFIYLRTSPQVIKERLWSRPVLPAYLDPRNPHTSFDRIYQQRTSLFEQLADEIFDVSQNSPQEIVKNLITQMGKYNGI